MILASLSIAGWLISYTALCAGQPFRPNGKLRLGRRAWNACLRTRDRGDR